MAKRGREPLLTENSFTTTVFKKRSLAPKQHQQEDKLIPAHISSKIIKESLIQQKEIDEEGAEAVMSSFSTIAEDPNYLDLDSEDDLDDCFRANQIGEYGEVDEEEERLLDALMSNEGTTLADIVLSKIRENDEHVSSEVRPHAKLDQSVVDLYKGVGKFLSKYTSGKMPKAFKCIPSLKHYWGDVLSLTEPEKWSANAVYQATSILISNLPRQEAKSFCNLVLLPRVREDIRKNKRLHFSLFQALKKSIYKPEAFNEGILFPLCKSGTCTLREAVIVGSVIQKISIPKSHPGAALLKLAEMEYCGTTSYFMKILLDKKYCLTYPVLDSLVAHFMRFLEDTRVMPVIWHQSLLSFVQWYRSGLTKEDKKNLELLVHAQTHYMVTPEIKRQLNNSRNRGEKEDPVPINYYPASTTVKEDRFDIPDVPMEED